MQKIKNLLNDRAELLELVRYVIAGVLTTALSLVISYGCNMLFSALAPATPEVAQSLADAKANGLIAWIVAAINGANKAQVSISNAISWVVSVIFAFWINRRMVFRVDGGTTGSKAREFAQFAGARVASFLLFEQGLMLLLKTWGVSNLVNRLIVLVVVMVFNYVASKFWIFAKKQPQAQAAQGTPEAASTPDPQARPPKD